MKKLQIMYKEAEKSKKNERKEEMRKTNPTIHCQIKNQRVTSFSSNNDHDK